MKTAKSTIKILLIDGETKDFPSFLGMMAAVEAKSTTKAALELIYTDTLSSGLKQLHKGDINLVLLGHPLPPGEENAVDQIKKDHPKLTVIAVAATRHKKVALSAVKNGANGYLIKGRQSTEELNRLIQEL